VDSNEIFLRFFSPYSIPQQTLNEYIDVANCCTPFKENAITTYVYLNNSSFLYGIDWRSLEVLHSLEDLPKDLHEGAAHLIKSFKIIEVAH
jgi:hypothetical protein